MKKKHLLKCRNCFYLKHSHQYFEVYRKGLVFLLKNWEGPMKVSICFRNASNISEIHKSLKIPNI